MPWSEILVANSAPSVARITSVGAAPSHSSPQVGGSRPRGSITTRTACGPDDVAGGQSRSVGQCRADADQHGVAERPDPVQMVEALLAVDVARMTGTRGDEAVQALAEDRDDLAVLARAGGMMAVTVEQRLCLRRPCAARAAHHAGTRLDPELGRRPLGRLPNPPRPDRKPQAGRRSGHGRVVDAPAQGEQQPPGLVRARSAAGRAAVAELASRSISALLAPSIAALFRLRTPQATTPARR